jgi:single-stranded-DNA-specific exonuclease
MTDIPSNWICRNKRKPDVKLLKEKRYSTVLLELLARRNIINGDEVISFLNPSLKNLRDPMELPGISEGIRRVKEALVKKENVIIFGDYDADGIISAALMYKFLKELGLNTDVYIPDRFEEGYDLSVDFLKRVIREGRHDLIISVDCGTNCVEVQDFVRENSCPDIIVCDHHNQSANLNKVPDRYIIINPKLKDSGYKFKYLSGAAVTFKFITAILRKLDHKFKKNFKKDYLTCFLDLVAISTIADIMPLVDENRIIVKKGLKVLQKTRNKGLKKMIDTLDGKKGYVDEYDIGFIIAPRLNAAGRIKKAETSFDLLIKEGNTLDKIVDKLNSFNKSRQRIQKDIFNEIVENNDFKSIIEEKRIFIGKSKNWNEGVLGIVASNIVKKFNIPAILFREFKGRVKGSGRSINKFDLYENLNKLSNLFDSFGGHRLACGISMNVINYETFYESLVKIASNTLKIDDIEKINIYDVEINFKHISKGILRDINLLKPFGNENPGPVFLTRDCVIDDFSYLSEGKHIRLKLKQNGIITDAMLFGADERIKEKILKNNKISILYRIEENNRGNFGTTGLVIIDLF